MKKLALTLIAAFIASPAAAMEEGHTPVFHYVSLETDYADWGEADRELTFDGEGWVGTDEHKLWAKAEGEWADGNWHEAEAQLLYGKPISDFWDLQAGIRYDVEPRSTSYAAFGVHGLAPYFFETDVTGFVSHRGDASLRAKASIDLLLTQRLIMEPYAETNLFFSDVEEQEAGSGISDIDTGIQLRYETTRKLAPYLDFNYASKLGNTRDLARMNGEDTESFIVRAGIRLWFN